MDGFNIPIVLFIFKRKEKSAQIVERISRIKPKKLYILADQGRDEAEKKLVQECRAAVEAAVNWSCELVLDYAQTNRGVYKNIGEGALRVLEKEPHAIFLEDDNLPELSFFRYCEEMLEKYRDEEKILWVCGTNYLGDYTPSDGASYKFTQHMLPCGWASWSHKFNKYYDGTLEYLKRPDAFKTIRKTFESGKLYSMYKDRWISELNRMQRGLPPISWDYQMCLSLRANNLLGVVPMRNQIKNIGVDEFSAHGGTTMANIMTRRYCGMGAYPLEFPLKAPGTIEKDQAFEKKLARIIVAPWFLRMRVFVSSTLKKMFKMHEDESLKIRLKRNRHVKR